MLEKDLLEQVLQKALARGADFAEVYVEEREGSGIFCEDSRIEKIQSGRERGAGIRVIRNGNTAYAYSTDLSWTALARAAEVANHLAAPGGPGAVAVSSLQSAIRARCRPEPVLLSIEDKVEKLLSADRAARAISSEVRQVSLSLADARKRFQVANSEGVFVEEERVRVRLSLNVVASREGVIQTGYESAGGVCGWELLEQVSPDEMAQKAALLAMKMLDARPAPAGKMAVVIASEAGGTMIHEACGHGLEADLVQKGLSVYRGKVGQQVASPIVSVVDDATLAQRYGSFSYDDEGNPGQRTLLIDQGVLRGYMYDRLTAQKDGVVSTGNGRRESYQDKPIPRMSNTFILPGKDDPKEIIGSTRHGLLVRRMGGGQVNTTNGDFVFDVQEGYLIEDGKVVYPVRGATLTGNGPRALLDIDRVGGDLGFSIGTCGKDGQGVPVADAQPTIRIKELTVGGTARR